MDHEQQDTHNKDNHTSEEMHTTPSVEEAPPTQEVPIPEDGGTELKHNTSSHNLVIVLVVAITVSVLALMYIWGSSVSNDLPTPPTEHAPVPITTSVEDPQTEVLENVNSADEITAIEEDLESTELESLDAEVKQIEKEIDSALAE